MPFLALAFKMSVPVPHRVRLDEVLPLMTALSAKYWLLPSPPSAVAPYTSALLFAASVSFDVVPFNTLIVTVEVESFLMVTGDVKELVKSTVSNSSTAAAVASFLTLMAPSLHVPANR